MESVHRPGIQNRVVALRPRLAGRIRRRTPPVPNSAFNPVASLSSPHAPATKVPPESATTRTRSPAPVFEAFPVNLLRPTAGLTDKHIKRTRAGQKLLLCVPGWHVASAAVAPPVPRAARSPPVASPRPYRAPTTTVSPADRHRVGRSRPGPRIRRLQIRLLAPGSGTANKHIRRARPRTSGYCSGLPFTPVAVLSLLVPRSGHHRVPGDRHRIRRSSHPRSGFDAFRYACWLHVPELRTNTYAAPDAGALVVTRGLPFTPVALLLLRKRPHHHRIARRSPPIGRIHHPSRRCWTPSRYACCDHRSSRNCAQTRTPRQTSGRNRHTLVSVHPGGRCCLSPTRPHHHRVPARSPPHSQTHPPRPHSRP
jgi:hypothetical protein